MDGGIRIVSIIGVFVVLRLVIEKFLREKELLEDLIKEYFVVVSVGILLDGICVIDLDY